jgi:hypothetical protein
MPGGSGHPVIDQPLCASMNCSLVTKMYDRTVQLVAKVATCDVGIATRWPLRLWNIGLAMDWL